MAESDLMVFQRLEGFRWATVNLLAARTCEQSGNQLHVCFTEISNIRKMNLLSVTLLMLSLAKHCSLSNATCLL